VGGSGGCAKKHSLFILKSLHFFVVFQTLSFYSSYLEVYIHRSMHTRAASSFTFEKDHQYHFAIYYCDILYEI
jgi:hypothetical protein